MSFRYEMNGRELPRDHGYPSSPTLSHLSFFFSSYSLYLLFISFLFIQFLSSFIILNISTSGGGSRNCWRAKREMVGEGHPQSRREQSLLAAERLQGLFSFCNMGNCRLFFSAWYGRRERERGREKEEGADGVEGEEDGDEQSLLAAERLQGILAFCNMGNCRLLFSARYGRRGRERERRERKMERNKAFWQQSDYKVFSPSVTWETVDYSSALGIEGDGGRWREMEGDGEEHGVLATVRASILLSPERLCSIPLCLVR